MITAEQKKQFNEKGYLLVPGVLSAVQVAQMRKSILQIFASDEWKKSPYNTERVLSDVFQTFPEFIDLTLTDKVLQVVSGLLGPNPLLMPESSIHYKFYTGWHKDTTSQEKAGHTFHLNDNSLMIEAGFYLQDNNEYGGGLTVMEGSHRTPDYFVNPAVPGIVERVKNKLVTIPEQKNERINPNHHTLVDIPSKAGDLVIFNFKTNHRATRPSVGTIDQVPKEIEKIAFFNAFSINNETGHQYVDYLKSRPEPFYQNLPHRIVSEKLKQKATQLAFTAL